MTPNRIVPAEPLPCPFCGTVPKLHAPDPEFGHQAVECVNKKCVMSHIWPDTERWNRRALSPAVSEEVVWLVEWKIGWGTGNYWCGFDRNNDRLWGSVNEAIRFSRKQDAEKIIFALGEWERLGIKRREPPIVATEHIWTDGSTAIALNTTPKVSEEAIRELNGLTREEIVRIRNTGCGNEWPKIWNRQLNILCDHAIATKDRAALAQKAAGQDNGVGADTSEGANSDSGANPDDSTASPATPAEGAQELDALIDSMRAISEGRESRIAYIYKRCLQAADALEKLRRERDEAVTFIRIIGEEFVIAGYPGGDRQVTLANVRKAIYIAKAIRALKRGEVAG